MDMIFLKHLLENNPLRNYLVCIRFTAFKQQTEFKDR